MKIFNSIQEFNKNVKGKFGVCIGNFDGLHSGHKLLINSLKKTCSNQGLASIVITFRPHPVFYFDKDKKNFLITDYDKKRQCFQKLGVDYLIELEFDAGLQSLNSECFIKEYLLSIESIKFIQLGHDFQLGKGKENSYKTLKSLAPNINIKRLEALSCEVKVCSSTLIRECVRAGNIKIANQALGYNFSLKSKVINGEGIGNVEFVPTANIKTSDKMLVPKEGVYFTNTKFDNKKYSSITNIGFRPTLEDQKKTISIETHVLDFNLNLYGKDIKIEFLDKHRDEIHFDSREKLLNQIQKDIICRREYND